MGVVIWKEGVMPREVVHGEPGGNPFLVKVGWAQDQGVQLGVEGDDGRSLFWQSLGGSAESRAKLGEVVKEIAEKGTPDRPLEQLGSSMLDALDVLCPIYNGLWVDFDRRGCNQLIGLIRRARDSAFGKDL